jgi:RNA polymerase sigma-70 factor (ECF subfamily)
VAALLSPGSPGGAAQASVSEATMAEDDSDEVLMAAVVARDHRAFRVLMLRHMSRAIRVAQRILRDSAEADDVGQEAFLRVWSRAGSFDSRVAKFTTWLYRIVFNLALDRARRLRPTPIEDLEELSSDAPATLETMIADEEWSALEQAMALLSTRQRGAIALFHMEGLSGADAARAMDLNIKAFESLLLRARATLKAEVDRIQNNRRSP